MTDQDVIDHKGYRHGVGIVVCNNQGRLLLARRRDHRGWQFPQGGMRPAESPRAAMYRELEEELGLVPSQVRELARMPSWVSYRLPPRYRRSGTPLCIGQKQLWWLLRLESSDEDISPELGSEPEFDAWRWVDYWLPVKEVVYFKRDVYREVLAEFEKRVGLRTSRAMR
ncbi:RNA pyrophosphohydrolase [Candidatus Foliamicus sp.]